MKRIDRCHRRRTEAMALLSVWIIIAMSVGLAACAAASSSGLPTQPLDYRQEMRNLVQALSAYAKTRRPDFVVIPQNGHELLTENGRHGGRPSHDYLEAIDGIGQESLFYGYENDDEPTPAPATRWINGFLAVGRDRGLTVLVTDYCRTPVRVDASYEKNRRNGYVSLATDRRSLDRVPVYPAQPRHVNPDDVGHLGMAKNFLYLINPGAFSGKAAFIDAVRATDYDLVILDSVFKRGDRLTAQDVLAMKRKSNGGRRLVIAYMSIGEAETYRDYWKPAWRPGYPDWIAAENPNWPDNFKVRYWDPAWQQVIFGGPESCLDRILAAGFDGVYLDIIDAFAYFESRQGSDAGDRMVE